MMNKFLRVPFANGGTRTVVPDSAPVDGSVSYTEGYGVDYQRPKTDPLSKNIERDKMNGLFFDWTKAISELQSQGAPDFITSAMNGGSPFSYAESAIVNYNGALFVSLVAANTSDPTDLTKWSPLPSAARLPFIRPQDIGATPGGVVNVTAILQTAFDSGRPVLIDELFLTSGNQIPSGSVVVFRGRGQLKLANNSNRPVLQNTNWQQSTWGGNTYGVDKDIFFDGLNIDGNDANQLHTGVVAPYTGEYTSGVRFFGVTNLRMFNTDINKARTFGIWCCAIKYGTFHNTRFNQTMTGTPDNQDGLHINGPAIYIDARNTMGRTNDDMVALNADEPAGALGVNVTNGPIIAAVVDGVYPDVCLNGVRLLSGTSRMDQITVRSVKGFTRDVAVNQSPYGTGPGNVGTLVIEDIDVRCSNPYQPTTSYYYSMITLDGAIDNVSLARIKNNRPADNRPTITITNLANIGLLEVDDISVFETAGSALTGVKPIAIYGAIDTLIVRGAKYFRDPTLTPTGNFISINAPGKTVKNLICSDWLVERLVTPVDLVDGVLASVIMTSVVERDGLATYPLLNLASASGGATDAAFFNCVISNGRKFYALGGLSTLGARFTVDASGASGACASLPANQAMGAAAYTKLNFSTEVYDRCAEYDTATQSFKITQGAGTYQIHASVDLTIPTNPTTYVLALYKGGVLYRVMATGVATADIAVVSNLLVRVLQDEVFDIRLFVSNAATAKLSNSSTVFFERFK